MRVSAVSMGVMEADGSGQKCGLDRFLDLPWPRPPCTRRQLQSKSKYFE
jgi:hypothetical protein